MERRYPGDGFCGNKGTVMDRQTVLQRFLWLWVVGVFAAYMIQFRDFVGPILSVLGLR